MSWISRAIEILDGTDGEGAGERHRQRMTSTERDDAMDKKITSWKDEWIASKRGVVTLYGAITTMLKWYPAYNMKQKSWDWGAPRRKAKEPYAPSKQCAMPTKHFGNQRYASRCNQCGRTTPASCHSDMEEGYHRCKCRFASIVKNRRFVHCRERP